MKKRIALFLMLLSSLNAGHGMQPQNDTQYQIPALFMLTEDLLGYLGDFLEPQEYTKIAQSNSKSYAISISINPRHDYSKEMIRYVATDEKLREIVSTYPKLSVLNLKGFRMIEDAGLEHLKSLDNLTSLNLGHCNKITDQGLKHLQGLSSLTSLNLGGIPQLNLNFIEILLNLTSLNIGDCNIKNSDLPHLDSLINLTSLNLRSCGKITFYHSKYGNNYRLIGLLKPLTKLTSLSLEKCPSIPDWSSKYVAFLTDLTSLNMKSCSFDNTIYGFDFQSFGLLTNLTSLNMENCSFDYRYGLDFQSFGLLTNLISLNLRNVGLSDENSGFLKSLTNLRSLNLENSCSLTEKLEENLSSLVNLTSLKLEFRIRKTEAQGLRHLKFLTCPTSLILRDFFTLHFHSFEETSLSFLTSLTSLKSDCIDLSKGKLDYLKTLTNLTSLNLEECGDIPNQGLKTVRDLTTLKSLGLCVRINGASESLELLNSLTNVSSLSLWCSDITDGGLDHLKSLTTITSLRIWESSDLETLPNGSVRSCRSNINITDGGLIHLATLSNLKSLSLRDSNITDLGLEYMTLLTSLTSLKLDNFSEITDGGLKHLTALTNLTELDHNKDFRKRKESRYYIYYHCPHVFENGFQRYKLEDDELSRQRG